MFKFCIYFIFGVFPSVKQLVWHIQERRCTDLLFYSFPLVVRVQVRVRASSGFDRGVGVRQRNGIHT